MFHVRASRMVGDGESHLGLAGAFAELSSLVVAPVFSSAGDEAGIIDEMTIEI